MASGLTGKLEVIGYGVQLVCGSFAPNGSSALAAADFKGKGCTPAYTSTGLYTLTLTNKGFSSLLAGLLTPQMAAATDTVLQLRAVDVVTAGTLTVCNAPAGSATDIAADANNRIHYAFFLATSSLNP